VAEEPAAEEPVAESAVAEQAVAEEPAGKEHVDEAPVEAGNGRPQDDEPATASTLSEARRRRRMRFPPR
jgi:hypothetical protein